MSELSRLEQRADVLMRHIEVNAKKIRQAKLKEQKWDMQRIDASLRILHELQDLASMINELWEHPDLVTN